jgi:hypothetical protein
VKEVKSRIHCDNLMTMNRAYNVAPLQARPSALPPQP